MTAQSYRQSGVSLEAGSESVRRIKKHIAKTQRLGMMGNVGGFGGMFDLSLLKMKEPILVSGTDGVGTKLKLAFQLDKHDTVGQDVVAMCVNDVLAQGAQPLFFLDYIAVGKNNPAQIEQIVKGVADGCVLANCALIGGETAEMPDMYQTGEYDIAGFTVGVVEKSKLIDGTKVKTGDMLIGIQSSGVHSNGFSLVRKIVMKDHSFDLSQYFDELNGKLGEVLLTPTKIYVKPVLEVLKKIDVHAICHITGGGFDENIPRVLQENQSAKIVESSWEKPPIFNFLEKWGNIPHREMYNIFNMGIGMILIVKPEDTETTLNILSNCEENAFQLGEIVDGNNNVEIISFKF
jgi:phosphoribosylformylglycinamidine cyclo-ligase